MKKELLPIGIDLSGKVAVVTGAGGVLCSMRLRRQVQRSRCWTEIRKRLRNLPMK